MLCLFRSIRFGRETGNEDGQGRLPNRAAPRSDCRIEDLFTQTIVTPNLQPTVQQCQGTLAGWLALHRI